MAPLMSLWGDGWFYVSGGGFLVSCLLFVFLLGQYRAAIEAEEERDDVAAVPSVSPIEKVYVPRPIEPIMRVPEPMPSVEPVSPVVAPVMKTAPLPAAESAPSLPPASQAEAPKAPEKKKSEATTTGGLSPAVVYLQNLKTQIDHLDKEIELLKSLASQQSAQGELILSRLTEVGQRLETLETPVVPAPAPEPTPPEAEPAPEQQTPSVVLQSPPPAGAADNTLPSLTEETTPAPVQEAAETTQSEGTVVLDVTQASPSSEPAAQEPALEPDPKPARKGPVWPI